VRPIVQCTNNKNIANSKIMDVGSGGGLPGVILAIALPQASVVCVDAVDKKMAFIRHIAGVLQLKNLKAIHARVEELPNAEMDVVTSRAFASLKDFAVLSGKHVSADGELVAMKGKRPTDEIEELEQTEWKVKNIETLTVPELDAERCLVWMQRKG
jgi:16S rRNA (guanine527-N7)-methyltransferase